MHHLFYFLITALYFISQFAGKYSTLFVTRIENQEDDGSREENTHIHNFAAR
jgi:hypothetical protein